MMSIRASGLSSIAWARGVCFAVDLLSILSMPRFPVSYTVIGRSILGSSALGWSRMARRLWASNCGTFRAPSASGSAARASSAAAARGPGPVPSALCANWVHRFSSFFTQSAASSRVWALASFSTRAGSRIFSVTVRALSPPGWVASSPSSGLAGPPLSRPSPCMWGTAPFLAFAFFSTASQFVPKVIDSGWFSPNRRFATWKPSMDAVAAWSHCSRNSRSIATLW
mmetsp:Transcript_4523/g.12139  ORF Transcript_4523/g.12139 Transcript_4523/m.12139 type:complete len:226 (+) Transcript_4523:1868-2545(+)